jgi:hypothetical protein
MRSNGSGGTRLLLEAAQAVRTGGELRFEDLERHRPLELLVLGTVHDTHAAFSQQFLDLIVLDAFPDHTPRLPPILYHRTPFRSIWFYALDLRSYN